MRRVVNLKLYVETTSKRLHLYLNFRTYRRNSCLNCNCSKNVSPTNVTADV